MAHSDTSALLVALQPAKLPMRLTRAFIEIDAAQLPLQAASTEHQVEFLLHFNEAVFNRIRKTLHTSLPRVDALQGDRVLLDFLGDVCTLSELMQSRMWLHQHPEPLALFRFSDAAAVRSEVEAKKMRLAFSAAVAHAQTASRKAKMAEPAYTALTHQLIGVLIHGFLRRLRDYAGSIRFDARTMDKADLVFVLRSLDAVTYMMKVIARFGGELHSRTQLKEFHSWLEHALPFEWVALGEDLDCLIIPDCEVDVLDAAHRLRNEQRGTAGRGTRAH